MTRDPPLLERERERIALAATLDAARDGSGAVAVIEGAAGLGKSRLLDVVRGEAAARGFTVAVARGEPLEREFAFGVALRLLEPLVHRAGGPGARLSGPALLALPLFEPRRAERPAPSPDIFPFIRGLHWLAVDLAERAPLLILVDDVQWCDSPSLRFLVHLAQRIEDAPIVLVAAIRAGEPGAPATLIRDLESRASSVVTLPPLTEAAVRVLVGEQLPGAKRAFVHACFEATGGNPLLLTQLLAEFDERGVAPTAASTNALLELTPGGVLRVVARRLDTLPGPAAMLALVAAVLGDGTLDEAAVLGGIALDSAARAADALVAAAVMLPGERLRFVHPLVRASVYAQIAPAKRRLKHLEAARMLDERGADGARVAGHLMRANRTADPWAVEHLRAAARSARAAGVPESAVAYLRRALEEPPPMSERTATLLELGQAEAASGQDGAVEHIEQAIELTAPGGARAALLGELGHVLYERGRIRDAAAAFDRGIADLDGEDEQRRLRLEAGWVTVARLDQSLRPEAVARMGPLLARPDFGATHTERVLLANVANQLVFAAEPRERALELARRALDGGKLLAEETAAGMTWLIAAGVIGWADELDEFGTVAEAAVEDARRRGSVFGFAQAVYGRAFGAHYRGHLEGALADLELAIDARRHGWEQFLPAAVGQSAWALVDRDELDAAERMLAPAIAEARAAEGPMLGLLLEAHARVRLARGDARAALDDALAAGRLMVDSLMPNPAIVPWRASAAIAASRLGHRERAIELADEEVALARRFGASRVIGMALRGAGVAHGGAQGVELLSEAVAALETSPAKLELARALVELGAAIRRERKAVVARDPLKRGLELALGFGAVALERRAREELAATGAHPRRDALSGRAALTPGELRIAEMAARGLGNREIAQALFLTIRTVETHLTHAYRKLDIASRAELPSALARSSVPGSAGETDS